MNPAVYGLLGSIVAALAVVAGVLLRNSRRSPETRTALDSGWDRLTGGLERRLQSLEASDAAKDQQLADQADRIDAQSATIAGMQLAAAEQARSLAKVRALNMWLTNRVAQLVAFITSQELTPPPEDPRP